MASIANDNIVAAADAGVHAVAGGAGAEVVDIHPAPTPFVMTAATATDIGGYPRNEDRAFIKSDATVAGVFDGHGTYGAEIAQWTLEWISTHPDAVLNAETFATIDAHLRERMGAHLTEKGIPFFQKEGAFYQMSYLSALPLRGGTTGTMVHVNADDGSVIAAHVGDSEVRVFDRNSVDHDICADHTATSFEEYHRIRASHPSAKFVCDGGPPWVAPRPVFEQKPDGTIELNPAGPYKFCDVRGSWGAYLRMPDDSESLAMTRALGDFNLKRLAGVTAEPHCKTVEAPPVDVKERNIVVASDGFWDILHYSEVSEKLWSAETAEEKVRVLMEFAKEKTIERLGSPGDNITIVVVCLKRDASSD
jgi:serine/threonine protein phosphatase PrpC